MQYRYAITRTYVREPMENESLSNVNCHLSFMSQISFRRETNNGQDNNVAKT